MLAVLATLLIGVGPELPPVSPNDLYAFDTTEASARECRNLANAHLAWLEQQHELSPWDGRLDAWIEEARYCRECWNALYYALPISGSYCPADRLEFLRDQLGPENYYRGRMPPPVPIHRFKRFP